jgi:hypothetical protein
MGGRLMWKILKGYGVTYACYKVRATGLRECAVMDFYRIEKGKIVQTANQEITTFHVAATGDDGYQWEDV